MNLFVVEVRRCLSRRIVWVLVAVAMVAIVAAGLAVFAGAANAERQYRSPQQFQEPFCETVVMTPGTPPQELCHDVQSLQVGDPRFQLTDLWPADGGAPALAVSVVFLAIGGLLAGASMIGAEWRAGTMSTVLTWEPRRLRLALAKFAAIAVLALLIAVALEVLLVLALVPAAVVHGSTEGVDAEWFRVLSAGLLRGGVAAAMAAVVGGAVAMLGRNTAAAFAAAFAYMLIGENVLRVWKPWMRPWLLAENSVVFLTARPLSDPLVGRGFGVAAATLAAYTLGLAAVAVASFRLRDVAST